jgi:hypothetical protein
MGYTSDESSLLLVVLCPLFALIKDFLLLENDTNLILLQFAHIHQY